MTHPYANLDPEAFWKTAISERHFMDLANLWSPLAIAPTDRIATAGSCFAQHIGRALRRRGYNYLDVEPPPPDLSGEAALRHGFGVYSARYGNIYTARQLRQLAREAFQGWQSKDAIWKKDGRYFDAFRPSVDPVGHDDRKTIQTLREAHLGKVRDLFRSVDVLIFTLGLTEAWQAVADGTVYPTAPGTSAGRFDPSKYRFRNYRYTEIRDDMLKFWKILREVNPAARMLLTVSPVPLTATASGQHVLVATMQSKSTLRAVAGDLAADVEGIHYFPSYEIIASHPSRAMFFEPNLRSVNKAGVEYVMSHFFPAGEASRKEDVARKKPQATGEQHPRALASSAAPTQFPDTVICDEEKLEQFADGEAR